MPNTERLRVDTRTAAMLGRVLLAEVVRRSLESADLRDLLRRRRVSRRRQALKLGAVTVGLGAAGLAAKRARHRAVAPVA
ncbi:MAG TPA: hypothetical protein VHU60_02675 [Gaiellaceae bacterium]|nr:hypothetical protein [Gaiellaceae bacterium]